MGRSPRLAVVRDRSVIVIRNQALYNDPGLLNNRLEQYTYILQEYFLPPEELAVSERLADPG